jgi:hypothetical protein
MARREKRAMTTALPIIVTCRPQRLMRDVVVVDMAANVIWCDGRSYRSERADTTFRIRCAFLFASLAGFLTHADLMDFVWGDDEDGGPDNPRNHISVRLCEPATLKLFERAGIGLKTAHRRGWYIERTQEIA